jgi:phospholipid transport system substrate-binding protein
MVMLFALVPAYATARDNQNAAVGLVEKIGTQGLAVLGPSSSERERVARFRLLFEADFDAPGISRFVLGPHVRGLDAQQQRQFETVFRDYVAKAYADRLAPYAGTPFRVTGLRSSGDEEIVSSQVARPGGQPLAINWHVIEHDGRALVTDVVVDNVSMKITHRNEFAAIIQRNGGRPEALIAALRQQLSEGYGSSSAPQR